MFSNAIQIALLALYAQSAVAVRPIVIKGANFVNSVTGNRFQVVGVAYQPGGSSGYNPGSGIDPLSNGAVCMRDAALMQSLGINAIRVYNVDPDVNHDTCASIFNAAGIYMLVDVNSPIVGESIDRSAPWTTYTTAYLNRTFAVVEAFKGYPNTLAFFSGNEVINDIPSGINAPYMRAVTRDLKNYIAKNSNRTIPVGYSAADVREILVDTWNYLQCTTTGDTTDPSRVDLFALNSYSWCGTATYQTSGYDVLTGFFAKTSVPVFFSEYGCNEVKPRVFTEVGALYGTAMSASMCGGVVYEWTQEANEYGLVNVNTDGSVQLRTDYDNLQGQYTKLNFTTIQGMTATNTTNQAPTCTSSLITNTGFPSNFTLPATPSGAADLITNGLKNVNVGKLIAIFNYTVTQVVKTSGGTVIKGLAVHPLGDDQSNTPTNTTTSASTTSAAPAATSSKAAASVLDVSRAGAGAALMGFVAAAFYL